MFQANLGGTAKKDLGTLEHVHMGRIDGVFSTKENEGSNRFVEGAIYNEL